MADDEDRTALLSALVTEHFVLQSVSGATIQTSSDSFAAIFSMILIFALKYRHRANVGAEQIEGSTALEITWSVMPLGVFLVIFVWGAIIYFHERTPPQGATEVYVVAKQWMWKAEQPDGQAEIHAATSRGWRSTNGPAPRRWSRRSASSV